MDTPLCNAWETAALFLPRFGPPLRMVLEFLHIIQIYSGTGSRRWITPSDNHAFADVGKTDCQSNFDYEHGHVALARGTA